MIAPRQEQIVPVRVHQSGERLMAIMPLPGLEPPDISVTVRGEQVVVRGEYRGPHQQVSTCSSRSGPSAPTTASCTAPTR